jgi:tRNA(Ile)-lysidine synthase
VALLAALRALAPQLGVTLRAAHFHHGIRGAEADRDEAFCRALCESWGVPFRSGRGDAAAFAAERGLSLETAARELRYAFLEQAAPGKLATAHNADDNAETLLFHLLRGSGAAGLGGIPRQRGRIIRPLLDTSRAEIEDYLRQTFLMFAEAADNITVYYLSIAAILFQH